LLPVTLKNKQRAVILWGTLGAIVVRAVLTGAVVWLLEIPGFLVVGGLGWLEDRMGARFNLFDHWRWDDDLIDLARWVGWIPRGLVRSPIQREARKGS